MSLSPLGGILRCGKIRNKILWMRRRWKCAKLIVVFLNEMFVSLELLEGSLGVVGVKKYSCVCNKIR
jgi:hypothetical protein